MSTEMADIDLAASSALKPASGYTSTSLHEAVKLRIGRQGLMAKKPQTIPQFFRESCRKFADLPALVYETGSEGTPLAAETAWRSLSYADYEREVQQAALMMLHVGLQPRTSIGILAFNCPEWFYVEMGALRAGGVVAGIYPSNSTEAVHHVLETSEASVCVVDDAAQMAKVRAIKSRLPRLRAVLQLHGPFAEFVGVEEGYYRWPDLAAMSFGQELFDELAERERNIAPNECALLIYTSGTMGMPKAVMLSHDAIIYDGKAISTTLQDVELGAETVVTYLPLNHVAAQVFDLFLAIDAGGCVYFADRNALKGTLTRTFHRAKPTRIFGVPRVYEKIQEKLIAAQANSSAFSRFIVDKSRQTVERYHLDIAEGKPASSFKYWLASKVTRQIKVAMGLDCCKTFIIGGAPVTEELKRFFLGLDMPLTEAYGLSESGGAACLNLDVHNLQSVGKAVIGTELKINSPDSNGQGEICIRGRTNLMGYLNEIEKTKETIKDDGWLHTGDVGFLDSQGNLIVTGRIKELIITAGGENIPPVHIEELVKRELPAISNAVLIGDRRKFLTMLLTIKTEFDPDTAMPLDTLRPESIEWMESLGLKYTRLSDVLNISSNLKDLNPNILVKPDPKVVQSIQDGISRANKNAISNAQKVQKFSLLPHDFSMATGELGPTLKIRRNIVFEKYAAVIETMYK